MRKFAAFDIDGTIFRWQLYHELFDELATAGHIKASEAALDARKMWQERTLSYDEYETVLVDIMSDAIVGIDESELDAMAERILSSKGSQTYTYTLQLLRSLKAEGYLIIAISGSHQQLVDRFCALHGIDVGVGKNHEVINGKLTANAAATIGRKHEVIQELVRSHDLTFEGSYAVGDSSGDITMLQLVENPIAFNPATTLRNVAMEHGWPIVVERKSIAYRLERNLDGSYLLVSPDA